VALAGLGDHATAVRLSAAARAEWTRKGVAFQIGFWDALVSRYLEPARIALGPDRAEGVARAGSDLSFEEAIREAHAAALKHPDNVPAA
jgi:hypothetical protein